VLVRKQPVRLAVTFEDLWRLSIRSAKTTTLGGVFTSDDLDDHLNAYIRFLELF